MEWVPPAMPPTVHVSEPATGEALSASPPVTERMAQPTPPTVTVRSAARVPKLNPSSVSVSPALATAGEAADNEKP